MGVRIAVVLTCFIAACSRMPDDDMQANIAEGKGVLKAFFGDLKTELVSVIKTRGPVAAIGTCKKVAPEIADKYAQNSGWQVGRTSLKLRNPDNRPDAWERAVLEGFEARKAAGEDPQKLLKAEIVEEDGQRFFRMMKAIPTVKMCTKCHGVATLKPITLRLIELYPDDLAVGYKVGDLRGAFTLKKLLQ